MYKSNILLLSNDSSQQQQINQALCEQDYTVHSADSIGQARQIMSECELDLIIIDTDKQTEREDLRFGEQLRQFNVKVPIVFIVNNIDDTFTKATVYAKPFAYICRPYKSSELTTQVQLCISQYKAALEQEQQQMLFNLINNFSMQITQLTTNEIFANSASFFHTELKISSCVFYIYNEQTDTCNLSIFTKNAPPKEVVLPKDQIYITKCVQSNQLYHYITNRSDIDRSHFELELMEDNFGMFIAPLHQCENKVCGFAVFADKKLFNTYYINLLQLITLRLSSLINNAITFEELNTSKQVIRDLLERSPQIIAETDIEGNILYVNKIGYELFNKTYKAGDPHHNILDYASGINRIKMKNEIKRVIIEKSCGPINLNVHDRFGNPISVNVYSNLMENNGVATGIRLIVVDVTAQKQTHDKLRKLSQVVEQNPNSIIITDKDGYIEYVNPQYVSVNEIDSSAAIGTTPNIFKPEYHTPTDFEKMWSTIKSGDNWSGEFLNKLSNGKQYWEAVTISPILGSENNEGSVVNYIITKENITERKLSEEKIFQEKEKLEVTLNSINDGVIVVDTNGKIIIANKMAEHIMEFAHDFLIGKHISTIYNLWNSELIGKSIHGINKILTENTTYISPEPITITTLHGNKKIVDLHGAALVDGAKNVIGALVVAQDVTEKIKLEEEIFNSKKLEAVGLLAGGIAHDFNNILTSILGNLTLAKIYSSSNDKAFEILQDAEKACLKSKDLTLQLLTFSRGGNPIKKLTKIDSLVMESASFIMRGSETKCEFEIDNDLKNAEVDAGQINQVINNILINAKQAMNDSGIINISIQNIDDISRLPYAHNLDNTKHYIQIDIKDTGCGISAENLPKIFDPYFTTKKDGIGLGLAISYSIIKKHNGCINVVSQEGEGTTFSILLPSVNSKIEAAAIANPSTNTKNFSILVMDDEESVRTITCKLLNMLGHNADLAQDGEEAIEMYKKKLSSDKYDVVFMDLIIPGKMGGQEAIKKLLEIDPNANAIISSGYSTGEIMSNYKEYGFKGVLTKPYKIEEVQKILNEIG